MRSASEYERLRRAWLPDKVRVLLIGGTPPPSGKTFFYDTRSTRQNPLMRAAVRAVYPNEYPRLPRERTAEALAALKRARLFLIDCLPVPGHLGNKRPAPSDRQRTEAWLGRQLGELMKGGRLVVTGRPCDRTAIGILACSLARSAEAAIEGQPWASEVSYSRLPFPAGKGWTPFIRELRKLFGLR